MVRQHIVFLTGAGISAESGLRTFRGKDGMWTNEEWVHLVNKGRKDKQKESTLRYA